MPQGLPCQLRALRASRTGCPQEPVQLSSEHMLWAQWSWQTALPSMASSLLCPLPLAPLSPPSPLAALEEEDSSMHTGPQVGLSGGKQNPWAESGFQQGQGKSRGDRGEAGASESRTPGR